MSISLEKSVRTCSVNVGESNRIQSDRFLNSANLVCVPWNGLNNKGQEVSPDSQWTKTPGCDSAEDRVMVENEQRPKYFNYVTLGAQGVNGDLYGRSATDSNFVNAVGREVFNKSRDNLTGNFGTQWGANVYNSGCSVNAYEKAQAQLAQAQRAQAFLQNGYQANRAQTMAGNYLY